MTAILVVGDLHTAADPVRLIATVPAPTPSPEPDPGGKGEDFGKSSPVALLVILLLLVAAGLLVRSMTKHLRRVPPSFDTGEENGTRRAAGDGEGSVRR